VKLTSTWDRMHLPQKPGSEVRGSDSVLFCSWCWLQASTCHIDRCELSTTQLHVGKLTKTIYLEMIQLLPRLVIPMSQRLKRVRETRETWRNTSAHYNKLSSFSTSLLFFACSLTFWLPVSRATCGFWAITKIDEKEVLF
jgi:hypothetical protein